MRAENFDMKSIQPDVDFSPAVIAIRRFWTGKKTPNDQYFLPRYEEQQDFILRLVAKGPEGRSWQDEVDLAGADNATCGKHTIRAIARRMNPRAYNAEVQRLKAESSAMAAEARRNPPVDELVYRLCITPHLSSDLVHSRDLPAGAHGWIRQYLPDLDKPRLPEAWRQAHHHLNSALRAFARHLAMIRTGADSWPQELD